MTAPKRWSAAQEGGWVDKVDAWKWKEISPTWQRKTGKCPRCGHTMAVDAEARIVPGVVTVSTDLAYRDVPRKPRETRTQPSTATVTFPPSVLAYCNNCPTAHPGHPESDVRAKGCGQWGQIQGPKP